MERILLVDDERALKAALATALRRSGYEVLLADSGEAALQVAETTPVDLLLTDLRMPGMGGLELLSRFRERQRSAAVIVMTAYGSLETAAEAMRLGAADYLTKPFKVADLCAVVARVLAARSSTPRAASPFRVAALPHEFVAAPGETGWVHDLWRVGAGRRGVLFAAEPSAGRDVLRALVRAEAAHRTRPQSVVASAQQWLGEELMAFFGVVDVVDRVLRFASRGQVVARVRGAGLAMGELTSRHDDIGTPIEADDRLVVASQNALAADPQGDLMDTPGLRAGAALRVEVGALVRCLEEESLTLRLPCAADDYIERTEAVAARAGLDEEARFRIVASVVEAVENAARHAYGGRGDGLIEVRYLVTPDGLIVEVRDAGCGFDAVAAEPALVGEEDLFRESGRGFLMMRRLMDAVEVDSASDRGTTVRMEKGRNSGDRN